MELFTGKHLGPLGSPTHPQIPGFGLTTPVFGDLEHVGSPGVHLTGLLHPGVAPGMQQNPEPKLGLGILASPGSGEADPTSHVRTLKGECWI